MNARKNLQVRLASRPSGWVQESDFEFTETDVADPAEGELVIQTRYLSLDPYMRGRMSAARSYAKSLEIGDVMIGGGVGEVVASKNARYPVGSIVVGMLGWQQYARSDGAGLRRVEPRADIPLTAYLGVLGMPGVTAWLGLSDIGQPKPGETVVVGAAAGAVGSVVGQLAKVRGCRAVGVAGGSAKCEHVVRELGFDACVDHRSESLAEDLARATPAGIDVYFENVGGELLDLVLPRLNAFARIPLCGLVSQYNAKQPYAVKNFGALLASRVKLQGFIVSEHLDRWPAALAELTPLVAAGKIRFHETITEGGLREAPRAFIGMLRGENLGKQLVKVS